MHWRCQQRKGRTFFSVRTLGTGRSQLHNTTFRVLQMPQGQVQNITELKHLYPNGRFVSLHCRDSTTQRGNTIQAKMSTTATQKERSPDTSSCGVETLANLHQCAEAKCWGKSHCSHKFSVQTQVNVSLSGHRIKPKLSPWKGTIFQCTKPNIRSSPGDIDSPHYYKGTSFSL